MDDDIVVREDVPLPEATCWAEWTLDVPCPNRQAWEVRNLDSGSTTRLCTLHRDAWTAAHPDVAVVSVALPSPASP